jgi:hypothetical protein
LNWKQKFLVLIGLEDKDKLEAKMRMRQLAATAYNQEEDGEEENERPPSEEDDIFAHRRAKPDEQDTESEPVQNEQLEEATDSTNDAYSEQPSSDAGIQRTTPSRLRTPIVYGGKGRTPSSRESRGTEDEDTGEPMTVINTGRWVFGGMSIPLPIVFHKGSL